MAVLPLVMTTQGLQTQAPSDLRNQLVAGVASTNADYTANLPSSLIEDIASTDIAACVQSDSFLVDLINSITPNGANPFLLQQFGILYGLSPQAATNTSVYVTFYGPPGWVIVGGFVVSDGSYNYYIQDGGIIGSGGETLPLYAISDTVGSWAVPAGSVTIIQTSLPTSVVNSISCTNTADGIPSTSLEAISDYRDRVMTAGLASSTGMARYLKTLLAQIPGVIARLVSARQDPATGKYIILCGGGDPYYIAYAIWKALFWTGGIIPAPINIDNISLTNPAIITTANNHNLLDNMNETITGVLGIGAINSINGQTFPVTVLDGTHFSVPFNANVAGSAYNSGGIVSPNPIVEQVTVIDYPDTYLISYVLPEQEVVDIVVTWATDSPNYISETAVASLAGPALQDYVNSLAVGTTPLNLYDMTSVFVQAVAGILPAEAITTLQFAVSINNVGVGWPTDAGVIYGDPNSYFYSDISNIIVNEYNVFEIES